MTSISMEVGSEEGTTDDAFDEDKERLLRTLLESLNILPVSLICACLTRLPVRIYYDFDVEQFIVA